ncbi:hypothetical protein KIW84_030822 [Lathyrus oleraceus]|uniref:DUF7870 domain-containing protein n=1 Tax=Pisum sativum TaxID=3888 RepID=A0A9D4XP73_PEA|nr:hypothetical protein KIW84_030822 [Pisum sativum]
MVVKAMKQLGFSTVSGVYTNRFFTLNMKRIIYELDYEDSSFGFVLSRDLDKVYVPVLLVLEISYTSFIIVVHVDSIDDELNLVVFKKRSENATTFFNHHQLSLPADCPSLALTKPLIDLMEPLVSEKPKPSKVTPISYLPKFVDVSTRKRLVYIDIGVGEILNANVSDWFLPSYPIDQKDFNIYFVRYNTSVMLSHVKRPGITFVYYPGLAGKVVTEADVDVDEEEDEEVDPYVGEEEFDFLAWFKETVQYADFVVLKMNAGEVELKFLSDVFDSGAICFVDELFLRCPDITSKESQPLRSHHEECNSSNTMVVANAKPVWGRPRKIVIVPNFDMNLPSITLPNIHDLDMSTISMTVDMTNHPMFPTIGKPLRGRPRKSLGLLNLAKNLT